MRLGVNAVRLTRPFTGVGRYLDNLLREWSAMPLPFEEVVLYAPAPLAAAELSFPLERYRLEVRGPRLPDPIWEWRALGRAGQLEVLFSPSYTLPLGYRGRSAVSYFGPAASPRPGYAAWRARAYDRLHRASARRAGRVLTAASVAKRRVVERYGVPEARVLVIPLAPAPEFKPVRDEARLRAARRAYLGGDAPYVLFVGKLSARHHIPQLLEAFAQARRRAAVPHRLLLVGPDAAGIDVRSRASKLGLAGSLLHVPRVTAADLPALYSGAEAFVFPASEAEGFGLPIVEAMACGTPVLSTALGSVPEVAGDAALLAPSSAAEALAPGLLRLLRDRGLRERLRDRGLERVRRFSWRTTAERTIEALFELAEPGPCHP